MDVTDSRVGEGTEEREPARAGGARGGRSGAPARAPRRAGRRLPLLRLLAYYLILVGAAAALAALFPTVRAALISPVVLPAVAEGEALLGGAPPPVLDPTVQHAAERALVTLLVALGALALMLPVAWVYMYTKQLRYDPSLIQSVIILPVVVAGILIIVKNSLALAFSLAGIVAAVRFRNTLKDPKDAVYIFLAIGTGIAAGVQALDVALVVSLVFNLVVLVLWRYNVGSVYGGRSGGRGALAVGDRALLVARTAASRRALRERLADGAKGMKTDGILLVHAADPDATRHPVEAVLGEVAKEWKLAGVEEGTGGVATLVFLCRLKKKSTALDLLGRLDDRWASVVAAAEFVPFRSETSKEKKKG